MAPSLSSLLGLTRTRKSCARVFSDTGPSTPSQAFEGDLAASLQQLLDMQGNICSPSDGLLSFNWMCKALHVVISAQSSAMQALSRHNTCSGAPHSTGDQVEASRMKEQYLEDSIKLLDVCCLVKKAMASVHAYVKASHLALKRLQSLKALVQEGDIQRAKHALLAARHVRDRVLLDMEAGAGSDVKATKRRTQLSTCSSMLRRMGNKITALAPTHPGSLQAPSTASTMAAFSPLYGGEMCSIFYLRLLSTALSSSPASHKAMTLLQMSGQAAAWAPSLLSLQAQLNSELLLAQTAHKKSQRYCTTLFPELHILEASMTNIYEAVCLEGSSWKQADLKRLVHSTTMLSHHLQSSIARLESQLECLLSSLVDIRMALVHGHQAWLEPRAQL